MLSKLALKGACEKPELELGEGEREWLLAGGRRDVCRVVEPDSVRRGSRMMLMGADEVSELKESAAQRLS